MIAIPLLNITIEVVFFVVVVWVSYEFVDSLERNIFEDKDDLQGK